MTESGRFYSMNRMNIDSCINGAVCGAKSIRKIHLLRHMKIAQEIDIMLDKTNRCD